MPYDIKEPIHTIFNAVEDLMEIVDLAGRPYPPFQILDLGYIIVSKHRVFVIIVGLGFAAHITKGYGSTSKLPHIKS